MNSPNDNIHTASGVAQDKSVRVRALGTGVCSKYKLHSPLQAGRNWKHINSLRVWGGKWRQPTVSVLKLFPNIRSSHGLLKHYFTQGKRTENGLGGRAVSS